MENNSSFEDKTKPTLNIDMQEYMQIYKIFEKENSQEIHIDDVYDMIHKFERGGKSD